MASLLSDAEKTSLNSCFSDLHDTFARDINVFKDSQKTIITTNLAFNPIYGNAGATTSIVNTPVSGTYKARIQYGKDFRDTYFSEDSKMKSDPNLDIPVGTVRLKVTVAAYDFIKDSKRIDLDGSRYVVDSKFRGHGLFDVQYYTLFLKPA
jgi:hypothetical protein